MRYEENGLIGQRKLADWLAFADELHLLDGRREVIGLAIQFDIGRDYGANRSDDVGLGASGDGAPRDALRVLQQTNDVSFLDAHVPLPSLNGCTHTVTSRVPCGPTSQLRSMRPVLPFGPVISRWAL